MTYSYIEIGVFHKYPFTKNMYQYLKFHDAKRIMGHQNYFLLTSLPDSLNECHIANEYLR